MKCTVNVISLRGGGEKENAEDALIAWYMLCTNFMFCYDVEYN